MPVLSTEQAYSLQFYWLLRVLFYTTYTEKSVIIGKVIQRKRAQSGAARAATGSALISAMLMVG